MNPRRFAPYLVAIPALLAGALLTAGPLNPPAGPVSPTYKTLAEVEPRTAVNTANTPGDAGALFKITQPGSYYLTGNIAGAAGKIGIEITASGVRLDLNGFELLGAPGSLDGVSITGASLKNIEVANGSVRGWGQDGVDTQAAAGCRLERLRLSDNGADGIRAGFGTEVSRCIAGSSGTHGIETGNACTITACSAHQSGVTGIVAGNSCVIEDCASLGNGANGLAAASGSTISACAARQNGFDGISVSNSCLVRSNACSANGLTSSTGAGIRITGGGCRIEANTCTDADRGISADFGGNIIVRNSCSANGINWSIVAGNAVAPIVQAATNGALISGATYAGSLGSTDPNANFSY